MNRSETGQRARGTCQKCNALFAISDTSVFASMVNQLRLADADIPRSFDYITLEGCKACSPDGNWTVVTIA